jgi:hypothetical protein
MHLAIDNRRYLRDTTQNGRHGEIDGDIDEQRFLHFLAKASRTARADSLGRYFMDRLFTPSLS